MRIKFGCRFHLDLPQPTPMIALLSAHYSRAGDLERPDYVVTTPSVPLTAYRDGFGNWCTKLVAPAGAFSIGSSGVLHDTGAPDPVPPDLPQTPVEALPEDTLTYLLGSRYCDTDLLSDEAWRLFEAVPSGSRRVQAICDFAHRHVTFGYEYARATRTASQTYAEARGVCRDFTHLAVTLCRCMNIPARYCTGYLGDIGVPPPYPPGDFSAWMEVYLGGAWWVFDPRNNDTMPRIGRVLVARGRDAADVPLIHSFGQNTLTGFEVWTEETV
ncbi:transglutaminase-like domain-containing protein [Salipiger abyssi]|uniref:transglutaminase-like domain-containing protein n=1 Tax=Salipiger abyssi TaxID=1250539 RepID=UPI001F2A8425|nr:transglutaminase family protein [Salipiger abyssi]